ncbi:UPF0575 protein C19orf67 homolog [Eucyclogobius newberryi]|uniref:UPF0575 protein C19orf67 homolog n=1 Tax=Eucyclogobius newberryi TaxID=166745 RepID=UPI003B5AF6B7
MDADIQAQTSEGMSQSKSLGCEASGDTAVELLSSLASVALAPPCVKGPNCNCTCDKCFGLDSQERIKPNLKSLKRKLHFLMGKADDIQKNFFEVVSDREACAASVKSFLFTCQPYFNHLESIVRGPLSESNHQSLYTRFQLFDFSQTLCNKLESLILTCASNNLLSLDETDPDSISHFHIGQCGLGPLRVTIFRFCQPTPYLAQVDTGYYKRMRWNVDRLGQMETDNTEFYFLCCEGVNTLPAGASHSASHGGIVWSLGQWVQASPETDDINDWILCEVPQGAYLKRVILGSEEPSCRVATDQLLQLLTLDQSST